MQCRRTCCSAKLPGAQILFLRVVRSLLVCLSRRLVFLHATTKSRPRFLTRPRPPRLCGMLDLSA